MIITEDTIAEFAAEPARPYVFSASGNFGGGTITLQWNDQSQWITFPGCQLSEDGSRVVTVPTNKVRFVASGTVAPTLSAHILPMAGSTESEVDSSIPKVLTVADANARFALTSELVKYGDIVVEAGAKEITRVTCVADAGGSLNSTYFLIFDGTGQTYVWFNVGGAGLDPGAADRGVQVAFAQNADAGAVASALASALSGLGEYSSVVAIGETVTIIDAIKSSRADAYDDGGTGFTLETIQQGEDPGGMYFATDLLQLANEGGWRLLPRAATDVETEDGSDDRLAVTPSALSTWWGWIKAQAQAVSGAWTWNGNQTLNGTSNTMPNQAGLSSSSSLVNRALLTDEWVWSAPRFQSFDFGTVSFVTTANAVGALIPGQVALTLVAGAVSGNYAVGTLLRELGSSDAAGSVTNYGTHFFVYLRLAGAFPINTTFRLLVGVTSGMTGTLDDKGIGFRMSSDTTAVLMTHDGTSLTESSALSVFNYQGHRHFLLENVGNGTVNLYSVGANGGARFPSTPSVVLTGGPTGTPTGGGKSCIVAQHVATGTTPQNSNAHILAGKVYWP